VVDGLNLRRSHSCAEVLRVSGRCAWALALTFHLYLCITGSSQLILDVSFPLIALDPLQNQDGAVPFSARAIVLLTTLVLGSALGGGSHSPLPVRDNSTKFRDLASYLTQP